MKEMPMGTSLLLLSKPKTKSKVRFVAIAALEEWGGKKTLIYRAGYPELMRAYGCKKGDASEFEAWTHLYESPGEGGSHPSEDSIQDGRSDKRKK